MIRWNTDTTAIKTEVCSALFVCLHQSDNLVLLLIRECSCSCRVITNHVLVGLLRISAQSSFLVDARRHSFLYT